MSIILSKSPDWAGYRTVQDVVFYQGLSDDYGTNQFALSWIKANASIELTELLLPDENGIVGGTGMFRIGGTVSIAQNILTVLGQLERNAAEGSTNLPYNMDILFRDGTAMSVTPGTDSLGGDFRAYLFSRYPLINDWLYAQGVRFGLSTALGGSNLTHTFNLSGFTFVTIQYTPPDDGHGGTDNFYSAFPNLVR